MNHPYFGNEKRNYFSGQRMLAFAIAVTVAVIVLMIAVCTVRAEDIDWDRLVSAIIICESNGNPNAVSKCGAIGLMQVTPIVYKEWEKSQKCIMAPNGKAINIGMLFEPTLNINIGTWYLTKISNHYLAYIDLADNHTTNPKIELILAAYNGGIGRLRKCNFDINCMPKETKSYIRKVLKIYNSND